MKAMEDLFREVIRQDLLEEFNRGMEKGLPQDKIDSNIRFLKRQLEEKYGIPFSKANGGEIFTTGVGTLSPRMGEKMMGPSGIEDVLRQRGIGEPPSEDQRRLLEELEGRDFTKEMQDEQDLRERERQMLEQQEREFIRGLPPERLEPEEPMFSIDTYDFDGHLVPAITFKDGEVLTFPEIEDLFRTYKTAPETNIGPETTRQIKEFLQQINPTKEQFIKHFFLSRRLAEGGVVEKDGSIRALGNLEYEADMRPFLHDSLSQLGFNPDKASYNSQAFNRGDTYFPLGDIVNIDPRGGGASQEIQAHEYRHRGLQRLLDDYFMKDPGRFKEKYGNDAYKLMLEVYDESRGKSVNLGHGSQKNSVHEKIAEYFQKPQKYNAGVLYYTSDGRVFQTEEEVREYVRKNPGVEFMRKELEGEVETTLETPRVKEFRDYMINKNRGETMQQGTDSEFEAVQSIQKAAADVLSGKYGKGGEVHQGVGSLSEIARNMNQGGEADSKRTQFANQLINAAVNAKGVRREAKQKFVEGDYAAGIVQYLLGVNASLPVYKQIYAGIGQALINADEQGDNSFTNVLKNLLNPQNSISFIKQRMNFSQGGEASLDAEVESLVPAVIQAESNNDPRAVSRDGAIGLMQILPETAMRPGYGVPNIFDIARSQGFDVPEESEEVAKRLLFSPDLNVEFGVTYLKAMRRNFDTMEDALRAYNTGPGNFNKYLMSGRDLSLLDQEAIDYPIKVAAANQGINPNEPADFARFSNSPEAFSTFMQTASEERPMRVPRPKQRPLLSETLLAAPAQPAPQRQEALKQEIEKTVGDVVNRESLQQKYSPEGIEKMLIGTIGESLLPRLFQRGSP